MRALKCYQCGKGYTKKGTAKSRFCSLDCKYTYQTRFKYKTVCLFCKSPFNTTERSGGDGSRRLQKFCSIDCRKRHTISKRPFANCIACGTHLEDKKQVTKFCSKQCGSSYMSVITTLSDPNLPMHNLRYKYKGFVFNGFKCNKCGYDKDPRVLCVHHIKGKKHGNSVDNLEVLCANCHSLEHYKGGPMWQEKIRSVIRIRDMYVKSTVFRDLVVNETGFKIINLEEQEKHKKILNKFLSRLSPVKRKRTKPSSKWWKGYGR